MRVNPTELAHLINDVYDAVERSKLGEILQTDKEGNLKRNEQGDPIANRIPCSAFSTLLGGLCPKSPVEIGMKEKE